MTAPQHNNKIDEKESQLVMKETIAVNELKKAIKENEKTGGGSKMYSKIASKNPKRKLKKI